MPTAVDESLPMLRRAGLCDGDETPSAEALTGGVASDIWRVDLRRGPVCVKRALAKLRVEQDWRAPVERNAFEAAWLETAGAIVPGAAPAVLAADAKAGMFAMAYLDPARYRSWKEALLAGRADADFAAGVGRTLARIHAATGGDADVQARFPTDEIFHAIRLSPYLEAAAVRHPELADALLDLVAVTGGTHTALVHGDVSPKNIAIGPEGPVFLDAECAWYGDPAFDVAFCLNHMLLKCLAAPDARDDLLACFDALAGAYLATVAELGRPEPADAIETRAARLLPGLFLARVDGKSPVEYVTDEADRNRVRRVAMPLLAEPPARLGAVRAAWAKELDA